MLVVNNGLGSGIDLLFEEEKRCHYLEEGGLASVMILDDSCVERGLFAMKGDWS